MPKNNFILKVFIFIFYLQTQAQIAFEQPKVHFFKDSIKIGEPILLSLVHTHKPELEILMPDSAFDFSPFEFISKSFYTTKTKNNFSKDSVVYTLSSFEIEPELTLALPVFVYQDGDTTTIYSDDAVVKFKQEITQIAQNDSLRVNANFVALDRRFNYPYLGIGALVLAFIALVIFLFFRKKILARYKLYFMDKDYISFQLKFQKISSEYARQPKVQLLEEQLGLWKKYLQKLEKTPYTTLTTKEITKYLAQNQVTSSLQNYDKAIYGGYIKEDLSNSMQYLADIAQLKFQSKQNELRNI